MLDYIPIELINILGIASCFIIVFYAIAHQEPPLSERINHDRAQAQKAQAYKKKKIYNSRYNYWFNKSYDHIDGMFKYGERDAYARKHTQDDLSKYNYK